MGFVDARLRRSIPKSACLSLVAVATFLRLIVPCRRSYVKRRHGETADGYHVGSSEREIKLSVFTERL